MVVNHLSCGTLCPIGALLLTGHGGLLAPTHLVCHCLLIETVDGLVLVDTGIGTKDIENPVERLGRVPMNMFRVEQDITRTALHQLTALGYNPRDVRHIVLTHLDFDHAGGLPDFPWAKIHVLDVEHEAAMNPQSLIERNRYSAAQFEHGPDWALHTVSQGEKWFGFENVRALPATGPDVLLVPLFGHTRGHCGVAVPTQDGWLLHAGDAAFHHQELDPVEPDAPIGIKMIEQIMKDDSDAIFSNQALLRQLIHEQDGRVRVICSHDTKMFEESPATVPVGNAYVS